MTENNIVYFLTTNFDILHHSVPVESVYTCISKLFTGSRKGMAEEDPGFSEWWFESQEGCSL